VWDEQCGKEEGVGVEGSKGERWERVEIGGQEQRKGTKGDAIGR